MFKSKLQELCQRRSWELPEYTTVKDGPDHKPAFMAYVKVHGEAFETPEQCKSAKDAQNTVARIAFNHFYVPPPPRAVAPPVSVVSSNPTVPPVSVVSSSPTVPPVSAVASNPTVPPVSAVASNSTVPPVSAVASNPTVPPVANWPEMQTVAVNTPVNLVSPPPSSLPIPPPGLLSTKNDVNIKPTNGDMLPQNCEDTTENSVIYRISIGADDKSDKETLHMYKNRLQQYAQKQNLGFPVYTCVAEGPPHARRFKSRVSFDGKFYETVEFFSTLKEAEQAAAKAVCQTIGVDVILEDGGLYKNLLQELAQKNGLLCPSYETVSSGLSHKPLFVSTVEISSDTFRGAEAKTKKQAEMNAAKVAYIALTERFSAKESSRVSSGDVAGNLALNIQPTVTIREHQDATEAQMPPKRAKSSPEKMNVDYPSNNLGLVSSGVENSSSAEPVTEQPAENRPSIRRKTVVFPRKLNMPIPEGATVMPYSDDEWVAYKIELH